MPGELLQAVNSGGAFDLKTLNETFATIANANLKRQELALTAQANIQKYGLEEQLNKVREAGADVLSKTRELKLKEATKALEDASSYTDDIANAAKDGKPLAVRLRSSDPIEADEAYQAFAGIRDKWRGSVSPIVQKDIKSMEALPSVIAKQKLAQDAEDRRVKDLERKQSQGDRRLDQKDNIIADTEGVNADKSAQAWTKIETGQKALDEATRHHGATEGIGKQNADTRRQNSDARIENKGGVIGITLPNFGHLSMDKIRNVLARGGAKDATAQEISDADVLRKSILAVPSGNKNPDTGAMIPRFSNDDVIKWGHEGAAAPAKPTAAPAQVMPPASAPTAAPELPSGGTTLTPPAAPATSPVEAPSLTPSQVPSSLPASEILKKYKIPARPATSATDADPATPDALYGATQSYLSTLGVVPAPQTSVGFGGFGLPLA